jgi:hypothetical protein
LQTLLLPFSISDSQKCWIWIYCSLFLLKAVQLLICQNTRTLHLVPAHLFCQTFQNSRNLILYTPRLGCWSF